jgi:hypothetical protein
MDLDDMVAGNGGSSTVYTHWDPAKRDQVDLADHPTYTEDLVEIPVYNKEGFPVKRLMVFPRPDSQPPALLADIPSMYNFFESDHVGLAADFRPGPVYAYPQAFSRMGNIQSEAPMAVFQSRVNHINKSVRSRRRNARTPIECFNFQGYNYESHRTRTAASTHAAQTGPLTVMFAGSIRFPKASTKFLEATARYRSSGRAEFEDLEEKIVTSDLSIAGQFRKEVVYVINMDDLRSEIRGNGG